MKLLILFVFLVPMLAPSASRAEFTAEQKAEIVTIMRDAMKRDPSILREAVSTLQADEAAHEQASARAALLAARDKLVTAADPISGNAHGDVTIVEFFDVRCPYCRKLEPDMARFLEADKGVRLVYKDLPILGPASLLGSKALLAAQRQNAYEKFRDAVMKLPPDITMASLEGAAKKLGLDWPKLAKDMEDPAVKAQLEANLEIAHSLDIRGTPALIVGEVVVPGAVDAEELKKLVADARKAKG